MVSDCSAEAMEQIRRSIDRYLRSIDEADENLAAALWLQSSKVSFIHPLGEEAGWEGIRDGFYRRLMGGTFSKRRLRLSGQPKIHLFGAAAVVQFNWDFVATPRDGGEEIRTTGRETQLYCMQITGEWRLVHVHYSGPAVSNDGGGRGF